MAGDAQLLSVSKYQHKQIKANARPAPAIGCQRSVVPASLASVPGWPDGYSDVTTPAVATIALTVGTVKPAYDRCRCYHRQLSGYGLAGANGRNAS